MSTSSNLDLRNTDPYGRGLKSSGRADWALTAPQPPSQFLEYLSVMRANLGWISLLALVGAGLGWLLATRQPAMYQARTVLDIRSLNENFLNPRDGSPIGTTGSVLPESYIQTEIKILSSDSLRKRALSRLDEMKLPSQDSGNSSSFWHMLFGHLEAPTMSYKDLAEDAAKRVKVRAVGNTRIVEVLCDARDGQMAANMCNNLAKTYIEYNLESRYQSTKETGDWLQSQLDDVRRRLTKAENDLKDSSKETAFLFDSDSADNPAQDKLRQLQSELSRSQAEVITRQSDYEIAENQSVDSLPMALDSGPIREYRMRLADLKMQLAQMSSTMTPDHYRVRELTRQVAEEESALEREREGLINRLKADYASAKRRATVFSNAYESQAMAVSQHADKAVRYNMLKREVDSDRRLYETLLQKVGEVGLSAALRTSTISVLDSASAPAQPYSPRTTADIAIGLVGGSLIGLAYSLLRLRADRTFHGPGEASEHLQLREFGAIPSIERRRIRSMLHRMRSVSASQSLRAAEPTTISLNNTSGIADAAPSVPPTRRMPFGGSRIPEVAEAFFGTMSSLRFAVERGEPAKVIVLTSPASGDGKTTVSANLAIAMAQVGARVVIVDGDLRRPGIGRIFNAPCDGGLAELLEANTPIEQLQFFGSVFPTAIPNLSVLPSKAVGKEASIRVNSSRMRALVERLRQEYDCVIIDSPPMLHIADARVLGWLADGVILVFRARKTTREAATACYECLRQDGINVLGSVLNDWNPRESEKYRVYKSYLAAY